MAETTFQKFRCFIFKFEQGKKTKNIRLMQMQCNIQDMNTSNGRCTRQLAECSLNGD